MRQPVRVSVGGELLGEQPALLLDEVYIFKGKLRAAATRGKHTDSADLTWLESHVGERTKPQASKMNLVYVGLTLRRYPYLELLFRRLGINVDEAKRTTQEMSIDAPVPQRAGDVQSGLMD